MKRRRVNTHSHTVTLTHSMIKLLFYVLGLNKGFYSSSVKHCCDDDPTKMRLGLARWVDWGFEVT